MRFIKNKKMRKMLADIFDKTLDISEGFLNAMFTTRPGRLAFDPFYAERRADEERHYLDYLKKQKLLEKKHQPSTYKVLFCMTEDAACIAALEKIRIIVKQPLKWDKKWRAVVFDIPENRKEVRFFFRRYLKELGFYRFQRSIWVTPYDITKYMCIFLIGAKLTKWVHVLEISDMKPKNKELLRHFDIRQ